MGMPPRRHRGARGSIIRKAASCRASPGWRTGTAGWSQADVDILGAVADEYKQIRSSAMDKSSGQWVKEGCSVGWFGVNRGNAAAGCVRAPSGRPGRRCARLPAWPSAWPGRSRRRKARRPPKPPSSASSIHSRICARDRRRGLERRVGIELVDIIADQGRFPDRRAVVDQSRHLGLGVEFQIGRVEPLALEQVDVAGRPVCDALLRQHRQRPFGANGNFEIGQLDHAIFLA